MNEENKVNYYAIIPATVRYDKRLKPAEGLLYGEIIALANVNGYCYAKNRYFSELYQVSIETVSRWISHLQKLNYIKIEIKRNEKKEILGLNNQIVLFAKIGKFELDPEEFKIYLLEGTKIDKAEYLIGNKGSNSHKFYGAIYLNYACIYMDI